MTHIDIDKSSADVCGSRWRATVVVSFAALFIGVSATPGAQERETNTRIEVLSSPADLISGDDALVRIQVPSDTRLDRVDVALNGRPISSAFRPDQGAHTLTGLVTGLRLGGNSLEVSGDGSEDGASAKLTLTSYPVKGPMFTGPHLVPYICMTDLFLMPDGSNLGPSLDADCSAATKIQYVYQSATDHKYHPMTDLTRLPADVAIITTITGATVPYVVRFEAGTIDRGVYNIAILHDPTKDAAPSPFSPPEGWNKRILWVNGFGCPGGWYYQGTATGSLDGLLTPTRANTIEADFNVMNDAWLSRGYAIATNTLNNPSISCNPFLAGEATEMTKEHFIKEFGVPFFTVSTGGSGGAYTSLQVADAFPGLFDGVFINAVFPEAAAIAMSGLDGHLLTHYFAVTDPSGFTDAQKVAVTGYQGIQAWIDAANQSGRTDPVPGRVDIPGYVSGVWGAISSDVYPLNPPEPVPVALRYSPTTNPGGSRPTTFDVARNVYGTDPRTGFALRTFDNTGVQYGLSALNGGAISTTQFLDLNQNMGGYDQDDNYIASRSVADLGAMSRAYQSGLLLGTNGGLAQIPVFDFGYYNDARGYHYQWFHFAVRARMIEANGNADNHVMWRGNPDGTATAQAQSVFEQWVAAAMSDTAAGTMRDKTIRNKPPLAKDGCYSLTTPNQVIFEPQTWSSQPDSTCNKMYPSYSAPRISAGGPLAGNIFKCELKPVDPADYTVSFTAQEMVRLKSIFPNGVCDWSKSGIEQRGVRTWASVGPSSRHLIFDINDQDDFLR
jgi:hypothetical protein